MTAAWVPLALFLFVAGWGANQFAALLPVYRSVLGLSGEQATAVFGVYALGVVPGLIGGGPLSDVRGRRPVATASAILALAGNLGLALAGHGFVALLVGRFFVGLGSGASFSAGSAWMVDLDALGSARRTTAALALGFGLGPLFAGALATTAPGPLQLPYFVHAVAMVASVVALAGVTSASVPAPLAPTPPPGRPAHDATTDERWFLRGVVPVAPWIFTFPSLGFVALPALLSPTPLFVGAMAAVTLSTGAMAARVAGRAAGDGVTLPLLTGGAGIALGAIAVASASTVAAIAAGVLLGAAYGWIMTVTFRIVALRSRAHRRGRLVGLAYALAYAGFGAPYLVVIVGHALGPSRALLALAAAAGVAAIASLGRARTGPLA